MENSNFKNPLFSPAAGGDVRCKPKAGLISNPSVYPAHCCISLAVISIYCCDVQTLKKTKGCNLFILGYDLVFVLSMWC